MAEDISTAAGGIHPGKPVIWPTGKKTTIEETQTTGNVKGSVSTTRASGTSTVSQSATVSASQGAAATAQQTVVRQLTLQDISAHLAQLGIAETEFNIKLAQLMLKYGVELSRGNFIRLFTMLEGTNKSLNIQEAALTLLMKGIDSPAALKILSDYFSKNPELAQQILQLQEGIANLQGALGLGRALLNPTLVAQIGALLSQFDDLIKDLPHSYEFGENGTIGREELVNNLRALKSLLEGVQGEVGNREGVEKEILESHLQDSINRLQGALENLVAQAILSKASGRQEVNYQYYQIPNTMVNPPKNMEIIVRRDQGRENATINPNDTQIILSMDTQNMGKISIVMRVKGEDGGGKKVGFLFNTQNEEARNLIIRESGNLKGKLLDKNFATEGFQVKVNPTMCTIKPYLIPLIGLEDLLKINIEA